MNLNKENLKKIRGLIVFTVILLIALWNYSLILDVLGQGVGIVYPFLLGGAIAFVINVPMSFFEEKLFQNQMMKNKKVVQRLARPISLIITLIVVVSVIGLVVFGVLPKLGDTFISIGKGIQSFMPKAQSWAEEIFHNNKEIKEWLDSLTLDWDKIINEVVKFFTSGASSVLGSTIVVARRIASGITTFVIAFVFACYILLQKEKLNIQIRKVMYAYMKEDLVKKVLDVCSLSYRTFSNFLTGQCLEAVILGTMFVICMGILQMPYAMLIGVLIAFTALIPIFGAFIGCVVGAFLILTVAPMKALVFVIMFLILQQIEGNLIYPRVVGSSVGLPSIWVLAAVSIGASLMGIVGMLVFIPIVSVLYALLRGDVYEHLEKKGIAVDRESGEIYRPKEPDVDES
ncbi:MAG: AI-2E family transporter [Mediterraneibacter gnavus]